MRVRVRACACACACACARAQPNGDAARRGPRRGWERTPQPCVRRRQIPGGGAASGVFILARNRVERRSKAVYEGSGRSAGRPNGGPPHRRILQSEEFTSPQARQPPALDGASPNSSARQDSNDQPTAVATIWWRRRRGRNLLVGRRACVEPRRQSCARQACARQAWRRTPPAVRVLLVPPQVVRAPPRVRA